VRRPTITRKSAPAVIGSGLVVASVIAGSSVAVLAGGTNSAGGSPPGSTVTQTGAGQAENGAAASTALDLPQLSGVASGPAPSDNSKTPSGVSGGGTGTGGTGTGATGTSGTGSSGTAPRLVVPDVIASVPGGVTKTDLAKLRRLGQVRDVLAVAGARISVNGKSLTVLGASASALRAWLPPETAGNQSVWTAFAKGDLITTKAAAKGLRTGAAYPVSAAIRTDVTLGGSALLGVAGVDGIVNEAQAKRLGLVDNVAVLINAPAADLTTLTRQVHTALGTGSQVVRLVSVSVSTKLPVDVHAPAGKPTSYLTLYQESAAQYCPGLSWTVLAAIGQIESADGTNDGPSTAGALGPMQFLPSTWQEWGISAFGELGPPNINDPFDAVPSAARMLCADGAADGGQGLRQAIFDYNHADWYVDEVLALANEYATELS
jgi:hypothetical protein